MSTGGQVVGGVVGAVAGFFIGGPTGALYGAQIGIMAGGYLDPPKGPTVNGPRLNDLTVQTSTYGAVIPRVYGTVTVNGNVIWLQGNKITETVTKKKSGGKGGSTKTATSPFTYTGTFAVGLCEGPIVGVRRIWIGPDLIYDAGSSDAATLAASNAATDGFAIYLGTNTQAQDPRIQADVGVANAPAWRGLAYIVFYDLPLARYSNSLMGAQVRVEVMKAALPVGWVATQTALPASDSWGSMAASPSTGVCVAGDSLSSNRIAITRDGTTWAAKNTTASASRYCVAWGENIFIAMRSGSGCDKSTDDGDTWAQVTSSVVDWTVSPVNAFPPIVGSSWAGITYGTDRFCAVTTDTSATTDDGINWRKGAMPASRAWGPIAHSGSVFCTVAGGTDKAAVSSDGLAWTEYSMAAVGNWSGMAYGAGLFVAVAFSGGSACQSSPDGIAWTSRSIGGANYKSIVWTGDYFLAVPYGGTTAAVSLDGITWVTATMPVSANWRSACAYAGGVLASVITSSIAAVIYAQRIGAGELLSSVVSAECLASGLLSAGDIEVTALSSTVRGYRIGSIGALRAAIEPLQAAWPFDVRQHGYKVQFVARGGASVVTIPGSDLDARAGGAAPGVQITTSREMDSQLARRVTVQHLDTAREYDAGSQYAERLNTAAVNALVLDLPIVMTSAEAAGVAEVLLYVYWLERHDVSIALPPTYNQLEPGDVVTLTTPEGAISLRLTGVSNTSDGRVECTAKYASAAVYTPAALGEPSAVTGTSTIVRVGPSVYVLLDVPMLTSAQSGPSFLAAMTGLYAGWLGGVLMRSVDAGSSWDSLQDFERPGSVIGTCTNSLGVVEPSLMDNASALSVTLTQGDLYSVTQLSLFSGANLFAYGADGRWEIIAAQTCTLVSGKSYILRDLMRGRFGTEWAMGLHAVSDSVVLLDTTDVALISAVSSAIGLAYPYRGITVDRDISTDTDRSFAYRGVNLKPLSPVYLNGNRDAANDWSLSWIRRTRDGGEWRDSVDVPLGEATEAYEIDVFADGTYAVVKRTIAASTPACAYSSANQVTDFGSNQSTLYLKIYQLSAVVGRGYPLTTSITR